MLQAIASFICGLTGHDYYQRYERTVPTRIYLQCINCSHESPGWNLEKETASGTDHS